MTHQAPSRVVLIRPHFFSPNPATATDNAFQAPASGDPAVLARAARDEVTALARALAEVGVEATVFDDFTTTTPDSVFPNNWFSTHSDGSVVLYPMYAPNRRAERRSDVLARLTDEFRVRRVIDYSVAEREEKFLEGTGAMVLDHDARVAYACRSRRLSPEVFRDFCRERGYQPVLFDAADHRGVPVYHTNVLMSVGTELAIVGSGMIRDDRQRAEVLGRLREAGKTLVEITEQQVGRFAGNCIELTGGGLTGVQAQRAGSGAQHLAMSSTAHAAFSEEQLARIAEHASVLAVPVPTIERAGGSVRCMIAGNHLDRRGAAGAHLSRRAPAAMSDSESLAPLSGTILMRS
ncbi:hypothetical protein BSP109_02304 [Brevibacterium sp. Mu109]|uniref:citrulline utilization hydrolase CtlX n=1 Tax=Brevibacterium sp. Mu109 TaxID=1255669 RepID=UPI000C5B85F3|nr:arginine deiminase-related protein [Brevibacterium sp. Mu109]SMX88565.1 hypothetical protein BSP109_02304 [Brevibacterium sp. Mu109]